MFECSSCTVCHCRQQVWIFNTTAAMKNCNTKNGETQKMKKLGIENKLRRQKNRGFCKTIIEIFFFTKKQRFRKFQNFQQNKSKISTHQFKKQFENVCKKQIKNSLQQTRKNNGKKNIKNKINKKPLLAGPFLGPTPIFPRKPVL